MPMVRAWFEGDPDELDAFSARLRTALGRSGYVIELTSEQPTWRTLAVEIYAAPDEARAMERLSDMIREADGYDLCRGGEIYAIQYVPTPDAA